MQNNLIAVENFVNQKTERDSFLMLPHSIIKNPAYQRWRGSSRASVAEYLLGYIIRGKSQNPISNRIFEEFYLDKQLLVTRFSDNELAKRLGYKNAKSISGYLNTLENEGIFKVIYLPWGEKKVKLYELGFYKKYPACPEYSETIYLYKKFFTMEQQEIAQKFIV